MSKKIITISREFGSGGRYIGEEVAKKLAIKFYDKDIISKVAKETGFSEKFIESKGEYAPGKNFLSYAFVGRDAAGSSIDDYLYQAQHNIITDIASKESCVIVGRCADYILKDNPDVLNVFIYGDIPEKVSRIMKLYGKTEPEALKLLKETDKKRAINYKYYTDRDWGASRNYAITLNSSQLGYEKCISIITEAFTD